MKPLADRVVVRPNEVETRTKGGLFLDPGSQEKPQEGTVVVVGDEAKTLLAGDDVLYGKYAGSEINIEGQKLLIMKESDVLLKK